MPYRQPLEFQKGCAGFMMALQALCMAVIQEFGQEDYAVVGVDTWDAYTSEKMVVIIHHIEPVVISSRTAWSKSLCFKL